MKIYSSNIATADYDKNEHKLIMTFINRPSWTYTYYNVPPRIWVKFIQAESHGQYFSSHIRDVYSYSRTTSRNKKS